MARKTKKNSKPRIKVKPIRYLRDPWEANKEYLVCVKVQAKGWVAAWDEVQRDVRGEVIWVKKQNENIGTKS